MKDWIRLLALGLLGCVVGCTEQDRPASEDPSAIPGKVISLSPAITETFHALGLEDRLIARSDYDQYPAAVQALPTAGTALAPNYEQIARLRPDLILIEKTQSGYLTELSALSEVLELPWLSREDVLSSMRTLSERFAVTDEGEALARQMRDALIPTAAADAAQVLLVLDTRFDGEAIWVMKPDSLHGAALEAAGVNNAAAALAGNSGSISIEGLLSLNPDAILVMTASTLTEDHQAILDGARRLTPLRAVRDDRLVVLSGPHVFRTGPSLAQFAAELRQQLAQIGLGTAADVDHDG